MASFLDDYQPVEDRLQDFWNDHGLGHVVPTLLTPDAEQPGQVIIFRADVYREGEATPAGTGHAHQRILDRPPLNKKGDPNWSAPEWTSPWEVAETSAIGRALANMGYAPKGQRPSREEISKAAATTGARGNASDPSRAPDTGDWLTSPGAAAPAPPMDSLPAGAGDTTANPARGSTVPPSEQVGEDADVTVGEGGTLDPNPPAPPTDWGRIASRLTKALHRPVNQTEAREAVVVTLKKRSIHRKPSEVEDDLANYAVDEIEKGLAAQKVKT
jgi:hypothetical protein